MIYTLENVADEKSLVLLGRAADKYADHKPDLLNIIEDFDCDLAKRISKSFRKELGSPHEATGH